MMDLEVSGQQQHLLLTEESDTEDMRVRDRILLHQFVLLQIDIVQDQLGVPFYQKWDLSSII